MKKCIALITVFIFVCMIFSACTFTLNENDDQSNDAYFMLNELPDNGKHKTDDIKTYFYDDGIRYSFEPSEDYGSVIPYIYGQREYSSSSGEKYSINLYGFSTFDGRIITGGIYSGIFMMRSQDGRCVFICEKENSDSEITKRDIITQDGSALIEAEYNVKSEIPVTMFANMPCECIAVPTTEGLMLYDFKGNSIINLTKAFGADCYFRVYYCDGEKIIFTAAPDFDTYQSTDLDFYCINKDGELIYTLSFDGYAPIGFEGGHFILVNSEGKKKLSDVLGNIITGEDIYDEILYDEKSKCYWCSDSNTVSKMTESGEILFSKSVKKVDTKEYNVLFSSDKSSLFIQDETDETDFLWFSDEGKRIKVDKKDLTHITTVFDGKNSYVIADYGDYADFYNAEGVYLKTIKNFKRFEKSYNGKILYLDSDIKLCISGLNVTENFKVQLSREQAERYYIENINDKSLAVSFMGEEKTYTSLYNIASGEVIIETLDNFAMFETSQGIFYMGRSDGKYVLVNQSGKILISLSDISLL